MLTENQANAKSGKANTSSQNSTIGSKAASFVQWLAGWVFLIVALYTFQSMAIEFQSTFINRDSVVDWLAPLAATSFMIGWLTVHFAEVTAQHGWRKIFILLIVIWGLEVGLSFTAFFSNTELLRQGILLYGQLVASGGSLRLSIFHQNYISLWRRAKEA